VAADLGYDNLSSGSDNQDESKDGVLFGGAAGYDYQLGGVVLGGEVELTGSSTSASVGDILVPGDDFRLEADRDIYVGARAGYAFSPNALVYLKGGYTNARAEANYTNAGITTKDGTSLDGFRVGGGFEYRFNAGFFARAEYRYSHYGEIEGYDVDFDRSQWLALLGYRF
jgi:outer membrane immunogenic protein